MRKLLEKTPRVIQRKLKDNININIRERGSDDAKSAWLIYDRANLRVIVISDVYISDSSII